MRLDPNEDLEEQVERASRERDGKRLVPMATEAGWISLLSSGVGIVLGGGLYADSWNWGAAHPIALAAGFLLFVGQGATLVAFGFILRMKFMGIEASVRKPLLLGIPGALVSGTLSAFILYRLLA